MPLYFFNIQDGFPVVPDTCGTHLRDDEAARREAVQAAGEMIRELAFRSWTGGEWAMTVMEEGGRPVATLRFTSTVKG